MIVVLDADNVSTLSGVVTSYGSWVDGSIHFNVYSGKFETAISPGGGSKFTSQSVQTGKPYIVTMICNPGGKISGYVNSTAGTPYTSSGNVGTNLRISLAKWYDGTSDSRFFNGKIGEVIIFNRALKDNERISVEDYLSNKWKISLQ
jgi:hypothetical protein